MKSLRFSRTTYKVVQVEDETQLNDIVASYIYHDWTLEFVGSDHVVAVCEGCSQPIMEGDEYASAEDADLCSECAAMCRAEYLAEQAAKA